MFDCYSLSKLRDQLRLGIYRGNSNAESLGC